MVSKIKLNFIISLQKKKIRDKERLFVIEGDKLVREFLTARVRVKILVAKPEFLNSLPLILKHGIEEIIPASYEELKKISTLKTPHNALAVVVMPEYTPDPTDLKKELSVALDCVQDPGNLGTIIRAAVWFGLKNIYCSHDCVDVYNSKVIQASMGAILQARVHYTDLHELLKKAADMALPVFGTVMNGNSIYASRLADKGIILLGNESKGISDDLIPLITNKISIPRLTDTSSGIDSLNVSMAASVIFSEFTRSRGRQL